MADRTSRAVLCVGLGLGVTTSCATLADTSDLSRQRQRTRESRCTVSRHCANSQVALARSSRAISPRQNDADHTALRPPSPVARRTTRPRGRGLADPRPRRGGVVHRGGRRRAVRAPVRPSLGIVHLLSCRVPARTLREPWATRAGTLGRRWWGAPPAGRRAMSRYNGGPMNHSHPANATRTPHLRFPTSGDSGLSPRKRAAPRRGCGASGLGSSCECGPPAICGSRTSSRRVRRSAPHTVWPPPFASS